ncbi:MAG: hypothetical protein IPN68_16905 [Bacteroidetes bacterium]|nr:hypothetical protein [Bacteroidota bacterium]
MRNSLAENIYIDANRKIIMKMIVFLVLLFLPYNLFSQTYKIDAYNRMPVNTCSGTFMIVIGSAVI